MRFVFFIMMVLFLSYPAKAESPYKGGMNYTSVKKHPAPRQELLQHKRLYATPQPENAEKDDPAARVWKKYQALAAGTYEEGDNQNKGSDADAQGSEAPPAEETQTRAQPAGLSAIIDKYNETKSARGQMRTLKIQQSKQQTVTKQKKPEASAFK